MPNYVTQAVILRLLEEGHTKRTIARILKVSTRKVSLVTARWSAEVLQRERRGKAEGAEVNSQDITDYSEK
jgi:transcriptional regulator